jgi:hypothetical protein
MASATIPSEYVAEVSVPSAAPVPRSPSFLLLGSSAGLLDRPGCPACRYVAEASDAYLARFALDGHYDADVLNNLCAARGMCPPHTRRLLAQPGAATRLTAVYRYVIETAAANLVARPAQCPGCRHDAAAAERVLGILLDEVLAGDLSAYKRHGGLCLPHLRHAAHLAKGIDLRWPIRFMMTRLTDQQPDLDLLAGGPDPDADSRAGLRAALPRQRSGTRTCSPCWAAADAERDQVVAASPTDGSAAENDFLCPPHLRDAAPRRAGDSAGFLTRQASVHAVLLAQVLGARSRRLAISPGWLSTRSRRALADPDCRVCRSRDAAASQALGQIRAALRADSHAPPAGRSLCVRHLSALHALDARAGALAAGPLAEYAGQLAGELRTAFTRQTRAQRNRADGADNTAWRRAAVFLDGAVLGGCPA